MAAAANLLLLLFAVEASLWVAPTAAQPHNVYGYEDPLDSSTSTTQTSRASLDLWRIFRHSVLRTVKSVQTIKPMWGQISAAEPNLANFLLAQVIYEGFTDEQSPYKVFNLVFGVIVWPDIIKPSFRQHQNQAEVWINPGPVRSYPSHGVVQWPEANRIHTCLTKQAQLQRSTSSMGRPCPEGGSVAAKGITWQLKKQGPVINFKNCVVIYAPQAHLPQRQALRLDKNHAITQLIEADIALCIPETDPVNYRPPFDPTILATCISTRPKTPVRHNSLSTQSRSVLVAARKAYQEGAWAVDADNGWCGHNIPFGDVYMTSRTIKMHVQGEVVGRLELTVAVSVFFKVI